MKDKIVKITLEQEEVNPKFGIPEDYTSFVIFWEGDDGVQSEERVPNHPDNERYQLVHSWYKKQDKKPFDFKFKNPPKK